MILDQESSEKGNVVIVEGGLAHVICAGETPDERLPRYLDHHITCPQSAEWRQTALMQREEGGI